MTASPSLNHTSSSSNAWDLEHIRKEFPTLQQRVNGKALTYLDNAASCQTPQQVINAISTFYTNDYSNIHRGVHTLSQRATRQYEESRQKIQRFLNAKSNKEIVFVRGTTEAINLVAHSFGRVHIQQNDEIIISAMEHHSNIVPWQMLCEQTGAHLKVIPMDERGVLCMQTYKQLLNSKTKLVGVVHVSNALGTINPVKEIIELAHAQDIPVLLDGAQSTPHMKIDVQDLDCDFFTVSGHKMYGPTGIGILYGKMNYLEAMQPYQGGGDMIRSVTFEKTEYAEPPNRFEAGTPNIAGGIAMGAAIDFIETLGIDNIALHEQRLLDYATEQVAKLPQINIIGTSPQKAGVLSFTLEGVHPHDIGTILDMQGIAVRAGHHCAQPVMDFFNVPATVRASFACFNTQEDIDSLVHGLHKVLEVFT